MTALAERVFVALGSNMGDRAAHLSFARDSLASLPTTAVVAESVIEETAPVGPVSQEAFLNQMVLLSTAWSPQELLSHCFVIEQAAGRIRGTRWGPRTLDIDIVRYGDEVVDEPGLTVPHPELQRRPFWQRELTELERRVR